MVKLRFFIGLFLMMTLVGCKVTSSKLFDIEHLAELVAHGDLEKLQNLDLGKADYKQLFGRDFNLMDSAVISPNPEIMISYLRSFSVNVNHQDRDGRTPLHHAIDANKPAAARKLLEVGADISIQNASGFSPLKICAEVSESLPNHETCEVIFEASVGNEADMPVVGQSNISDAAGQDTFSSNLEYQVISGVPSDTPLFGKSIVMTDDHIYVGDPGKSRVAVFERSAGNKW